MLIGVMSKKRIVMCIGLIVIIVTFGICLFVNNSSIERDKPIHLKSGGTSFDWNIDPSNIGDLKSEADIVAKVRYTGEKQSYKVKDDCFVRTAYTVDVIDVINGDISKSQIEIISLGGKIPLKDFIDNCSEQEKKEYLEQDPDMLDINTKALEESTYEDVDHFGVELTKNDEALVFLKQDKSTEGDYVVVCAGLGLFEKSKGERIYKNEDNKVDVTLDEKTIQDM